MRLLDSLKKATAIGPTPLLRSLNATTVATPSLRYVARMRTSIFRFAAIATLGLLAVGCGKARVEETCTMNGFGQGECNFTNTGTAAGSLCGRIVVRKKSDETDSVES